MTEAEKHKTIIYIYSWSGGTWLILDLSVCCLCYNDNNNPKVNNWDNYVWRPITLANYGFNSCSFFSSVINPPLPNGQNDPTKQAVAIIYHLLLLLKKKKKNNNYQILLIDISKQADLRQIYQSYRENKTLTIPCIQNSINHVFYSIFFIGGSFPSCHLLIGHLNLKFNNILNLTFYFCTRFPLLPNSSVILYNIKIKLSHIPLS